MKAGARKEERMSAGMEEQDRDKMREVRDRKALRNMRPCVLNALENGVQSGAKFEAMRHSIIAELIRLGYEEREIKERLITWNALCERPLTGKILNNHLMKYVNWCLKRDVKTGCKTLEAYCVGERRCWYVAFSEEARRRYAEQPLPFEMNELERYMRERYGPRAEMLISVVKILRVRQVQNLTGEVIFAPCRKVAIWIAERYGYRITKNDVFYALKVFEMEGVLGLRVQGKSGPNSKESNGYSFLLWKHPVATTVAVEPSPPIEPKVSTEPSTDIAGVSTTAILTELLPICVPTDKRVEPILCPQKPMEEDSLRLMGRD